jgi:hypothetical protein
MPEKKRSDSSQPVTIYRILSEIRGNGRGVRTARLRKNSARETFSLTFKKKPAKIARSPAHNDETSEILPGQFFSPDS